jgi:hypothetical protein
MATFHTGAATGAATFIYFNYGTFHALFLFFYIITIAYNDPGLCAVAASQHLLLVPVAQLDCEGYNISSKLAKFASFDDIIGN